MNLFPSPIGELHFSIFVSNLYDISQPIVSVPYRGATFLNYYMYISSICKHLFPSPIGELHFSIFITKYDRRNEAQVSVPYRGATFLNEIMMDIVEDYQVSVPYRGATFLNAKFFSITYRMLCFRPLSGSYISQYHPRNPMSCLGRIGGLRGKSNFIEIQPFWKVKSSHKSSI